MLETFILKPEIKEVLPMVEQMDKALTDLAEMTIEVIEHAKAKGTFNKELIEAVCIVMSMYYGRFSDDK